MPTPDRRHVYKYFERGDCFVRIRLCDVQSAGLEVSPGLDREGYRRAVVAACVEELQEDYATGLAQLAGGDAPDAVERLYELCIAVNRGLDIQRVALPGVGRDAARGARGAPLEHGASPAPERQRARFQRRLRRRAGQFEARLAERVVGQPHAVERVARSVRRAATGLSSLERPLGSFLFVGPTGTGKTQLARALAAELFGAGEGLVRIDCSELAQRHESSRLVGAPPGYVGYEDGGTLTNAVRRTPQAVVLFDEIEKAHPQVHHLLLQVLDEGHLTDHRGERVAFDQTFVVMTSNAGATEMAAAAHPAGFGCGGVSAATLETISDTALARQFGPEFLGRIDECVLFSQLEMDDARAIATRQLTDVARRLRARGPRICFDESVADWVAERGFDDESGAREIRRAVQNDVEGPLADFLLELRGPRRPFLRARVVRGRLSFELEPAGEDARD